MVLSYSRIGVKTENTFIVVICSSFFNSTWVNPWYSKVNTDVKYGVVLEHETKLNLNKI